MLVAVFALTLAVSVVVPASRAFAVGTIQVTPAAGLVDQRSVTVSGGGFTPNVSLAVTQCGSEATSAAGCGAAFVLTTTNASGNYSATFTVNRSLVTTNGTIDCAVSSGRCVVVAAKVSDQATRAVTPISFGRVQATLAAGLVDQRSVTVSGGGFTPNAALAVAQCRSDGTSASGCESYVSITADASGNYSTMLTVRRNLATIIGSPPNLDNTNHIDCNAPGQCVVVVAEISDLTKRATTPIAFGTAQVIPTAGLVDLGSVAVAGGGFAPSTTLAVTQCVSEATSAAGCGAPVLVTSSSTGSYATTLTVRRNLVTTGSGTVDCAASNPTSAPASEGRCIVVALDPTDLATSVPTPICFTPSGCLPSDVQPPAGIAPLRYRDPIFSDITTTADLTYGNAVNWAGQPVALELDIYEPTGDTVTARPVVIDAHGGGFAGGSKSLTWATASLVRRGFVVASINYRLVPANSNLVCDADDPDPDPNCITTVQNAVNDAQAAVRWLRANATTYRIDSTRIAIQGSSAGGAIATAVGVVPATDESSGSPGYPSNVSAWVSKSAGLPDPIIDTYIDAGDPPGMLFNGTADEDVPYQLGVKTAQALHDVGSFAVLRLRQGGTHSGEDPRIVDTQCANFYYLTMDLTHAAQ
jgi:predicted esterase